MIRDESTASIVLDGRPPAADLKVTSVDPATTWPARPAVFAELLTAVEAAQYLRLDELGTHTPRSAVRTLKHWRDRGDLKATKYARHVWYRKSALDQFLVKKTEP